MDIDLLSKMVKELLLDNDNVILPGLGSFVAEIVPSTFSDKGYTINPPYRKLYFRSKPDEGYKLVEFYASSNKVELAIADKVIRDFVAELKQVLFARKTVVFPGLGRLRATKENAVFFVADEDLDIYPEGFGLQPISLKTHVETPAEVTAVVEGLKAMVDIPEVKPSPETVAEPKQEEILEEPLTIDEPEIEDETGIAADLVIEDEPVAVPMIEEEPVAVPIIEEEPINEEEPAAEDKPIAENEPDVIEIAASEDDLSAEQKSQQLPRRRGFWKTLALVIIWLIVVAVLALGLFVVAAHFMPDFIDQILYTPEELEIINR
ncbi:MAG: hypothetical protein E7116_09285 [Bacteroidales bacterium]|nr:hypothetical protein [Bacteroidales bacterium]